MIPPSRLLRLSTPDVLQDDDSSTAIESDAEDILGQADSDLDLELEEVVSAMERLADELLSRPPIYIMDDQGRWREPTAEVSVRVTQAPTGSKLVILCRRHWPPRSRWRIQKCYPARSLAWARATATTIYLGTADKRTTA